MDDENEQLCLKWKTHQSTIISSFEALLQNGALVDCTLVAEGQFLGAHRLVLSACSPMLARLLAQPYDKHPIFILKDVTFKELGAIMDYMYRGEVNIEQDKLDGLIKAAESLQIKGLTKNQQSFNGGDHQQNSEPVTEQKEEATQHNLIATAAIPAIGDLATHSGGSSIATSIAASRKRRIIITTKNVNKPTVSSSQSQKPQNNLPPKRSYLLRNQRDSDQPSEDDASDENDDNDKEPPAQRPKTTNFECPQCDNAYKHIYSLRRHLIKQHKRTEPSKQQPPEGTVNSVHSDELIDVESLWEDEELLVETNHYGQPEFDPLLNDEVALAEATVKTSFQCRKCGRAYQSYRSLERHQIQHNHMESPKQRQNDDQEINKEYEDSDYKESSTDDEGWLDPAQDNKPLDNESALNFYCPFCIYSAKYKRYLKAHLIRRHRSRFTLKLYESITPK